MMLNMSFKIVDGEVRGDREHVMDMQLSRNVSCFEGCAGGNDVLCPYRETLVRALEADADCGAALAKVNPLPLPTIPMGDCRSAP